MLEAISLKFGMWSTDQNLLHAENLGILFYSQQHLHILTMKQLS